MEKDEEKFCRLCRECQRVSLPEDMRRTELKDMARSGRCYGTLAKWRICPCDRRLFQSLF